MRPVNLIPPEQRRGDRAPLRTGIASYALVAVLAVVLGLVTMLVLTGNQIADHKAEKSELEARKAAAEQEVAELAPYAEFASLQETRRQTVASLAQSRFDWERVLRELAIVLPENVWLVKLAGTVTPEVQVEGAPGISSRASIPGPALELVGCGADQDAVAGFVAALEDIDGVTRVGVDESKRPDLAGGEVTGAASQGSEDDCRTRDMIARFEIVAAFDAAAVPAVAAAPAVEEPPAEAPTGEESQVTEEAADARETQAEETADAREAADIVPGVAR